MCIRDRPFPVDAISSWAYYSPDTRKGLPQNNLKRIDYPRRGRQNLVYLTNETILHVFLENLHGLSVLQKLVKELKYQTHYCRSY